MIGDLILGAIIIAALFCLGGWLDEETRYRGFWNAVCWPLASGAFLSLFGLVVLWALYSFLTR